MRFFFGTNSACVPCVDILKKKHRKKHSLKNHFTDKKENKYTAMDITDIIVVRNTAQENVMNSRGNF
jgi:hypothetical protein